MMIVNHEQHCGQCTLLVQIMPPLMWLLQWPWTLPSQPHCVPGDGYQRPVTLE